MPKRLAAIDGIVKIVEGALQKFLRKDLSAGRQEFTLVFLSIDLITESNALSGKECRRDAGASMGRHLGAEPGGFAAVPLVIKETGLAVGGGHEPERATGDSEHGIESVVERIRNEGGLTDDEDRKSVV